MMPALCSRQLLRSGSCKTCTDLSVAATTESISLCLCLCCLQPKPALVSISHVPTSSGRVYDAQAVGAAAAAAGVPFLLDACQSVGQMPLDVQQLQCDFLTGIAAGLTARCACFRHHMCSL